MAHSVSFFGFKQYNLSCSPQLPSSSISWHFAYAKLAVKASKQELFVGEKVICLIEQPVKSKAVNNTLNIFALHFAKRC